MSSFSRVAIVILLHALEAATVPASGVVATSATAEDGFGPRTLGGWVE